MTYDAVMAEQSRERFLGLVWPVLRPMMGATDLAPAEGAPGLLPTYLDQVLGIDYVFRIRGRGASLASRVLNDQGHRSWTFRAREHDRLAGVDPVPWAADYVCQAYVRGDELQAFAVIPSQLLLSLARACRAVYRSPRGGDPFWAYDWSLVADPELYPEVVMWPRDVVVPAIVRPYLLPDAVAVTAQMFDTTEWLDRERLPVHSGRFGGEEHGPVSVAPGNLAYGLLKAHAIVAEPLIADEAYGLLARANTDHSGRINELWGKGYIEQVGNRARGGRMVKEMRITAAGREALVVKEGA